MQKRKKTGIDWCERRMIRKLYMDHSVRVRLDQEERRSMRSGRGVRQGCCLSPILFKYLTKKALEGCGHSKIGKVIRTVKYANEILLVAKEETVLQRMDDRLIEIGRCYGMEMLWGEGGRGELR